MTSIKSSPDSAVLGAVSSRYVQGEYLESNPTWHIEDSPWKAEQVMALIEDAGLHPRSVGEVGCGAGEILAQLATMMDESTDFTGIEVSPQAYELCLSREQANIHFLLGDICELSDIHFDLLLIVDVIEHVEDYRGLLRGLSGKADRFIFNIPMDFNVYTSLRQSSLHRGWAAMGHIHHFNHSTALDTLQDTGFEILDQRYIHPWSDPRMRRNTSPLSRLLSLARRGLWRASPDIAVKALGAASLLVLAESREDGN